MSSRTRFGWLVTLGSLLCLALVVEGISLYVLAAGDSDADAGTSNEQLMQPTATPTLPPGNDWAQYRYDFVGTGVNPEDSISSSNGAQLRSAWVHDNKGRPYESSPAIVNGVIYIPSANTLSAYDLRTGAILWTFKGIEPALGAVNSSVAVDSALHLAYYGAPNGYVYAVDTRTGRSIWVTRIGDPDQGAYVWSTPFLAHGNVYIGLASRNDKPCVRGAVVALDAANGITRWTHYTALSNELGGGVWSSVVADPDDHAILATTGNPCTTIFSTYQQDSIVAMDWDTGETLWKYTALETDNCDCDFGAGPVVYTIKGQKYIVAGNKHGTLYGLARTPNGVRLAWSIRFAEDEYPNRGGIFQPPAYKDGILYAASGYLLDGSCGGAVWAVRGDTGAIVWKKCTHRRAISPGAISGDLLFVAQPGELDAYDLKTGEIRWHAPVPGEIWGGTAISRGYVVQGSVSGKLYCFTVNSA